MSRKNTRRRYKSLGKRVFAKRKYTRCLTDWNATCFPWEYYGARLNEYSVLYLKNLPHDKAVGWGDTGAVGFYDENGKIVVIISDSIFRGAVGSTKKRGIELMRRENANYERMDADLARLNGKDINQNNRRRPRIQNWRDAIKHVRRMRRWQRRHCLREVRIDYPSIDEYIGCGLDSPSRDGRYCWNGPLWSVFRANSRTKAVRLMKFWCKKAGVRVVDCRRQANSVRHH